MFPQILARQKQTQTAFVALDTNKCNACWLCLPECPNKVIGKTDGNKHSHAFIVFPKQCKGCLQCVKVCPTNAFILINTLQIKKDKEKKRLTTQLVVYIFLFTISLLMILSGLTLQIRFHIGNQKEFHEDAEKLLTPTMTYEQVRAIDATRTVVGFNYADWSLVHKIAIALFTVLLTYHIFLQRKWYGMIFAKNLWRKHIQAITLSLLLLLVAITGYIPWFAGVSEATRNLLIEIHDKLAILLVVLLVWHVAKRIKWFLNAYSKLYL